MLGGSLSPAVGVASGQGLRSRDHGGVEHLVGLHLYVVRPAEHVVPLCRPVLPIVTRLVNELSEGEVPELGGNRRLLANEEVDLLQQGLLPIAELLPDPLKFLVLPLSIDAFLLLSLEGVVVFDVRPLDVL